MKIIGAIQAFQEADKIGGAVESCFAAGCDRVVVLDGAWTLPDGTPFGGGPAISDDGTREAAEAAGARFLLPSGPVGDDGGKRDMLIRSLDARTDDRVFILDADERIHGQIDRENLPPSHAVVLLKNLRENDLPGIRGTWPHGDYGPVVPLIRWLRWSSMLRCDGPGRYRVAGYVIEPYLVGQLRGLVALGAGPPVQRALEVLTEIGADLTPEQACALPVLPGVEIHHALKPSRERVAAKVRFYETRREMLAPEPEPVAA